MQEDEHRRAPAAGGAAAEIDAVAERQHEGFGHGAGGWVQA
jgi:hypothetical protein